MIVDKNHKVIYLHNPKCGGTFLRDIYIKKYGKTDATKWWKLFSKEYGTDLGHISYNDLPRFVPEWEEYRLLMMARNPYNRFYSSVKELRNQLKLIRIFSIINVPVRVSNNKYNDWSLLRKIYESFRRICPWTYTHLLWKLLSVSTEDVCKQMISLKRDKQDFILRNKEYPWLNPQSDFIGEKIEVLRYESFSDWEILLDAFGLSEYNVQVKIAKEYDIPQSVCEMIRRLYPEDSMLFDLYERY